MKTLVETPLISDLASFKSALRGLDPSIEAYMWITDGVLRIDLKWGVPESYLQHFVECEDNHSPTPESLRDAYDTIRPYVGGYGYAVRDLK